MTVRKPSALLAAVQVVVAAAYLVITAVMLCSPLPGAARFPALLTACALAAVIFRQGWVIPCALLGPLVAMLIIPPFRDGPVLSQVELNATTIAIGAVGGLGVGLVIDLYTRIKRQILAQRNMGDSRSGPEDHPRS